MRTFLAMACTLSLGVGSAAAGEILVTVRNLQPQGGAFLTPVFLATQDGTYDFFNQGAGASSSVERLAEDGTTAPRIAAALATGRVAQALATMGGPLAPGESRSVRFNVDPANPQARFLAFMSMIIPSNDGFIGNDNPQLLPLFDANGNLIVRSGASAFLVLGSDVFDAGTEVNDEVPLHTAFLGQVTPNTGVDENGVIRRHAGFIGSAGLGGGPAGNILTAFPNADFTLPGSQIASISVTAIPVPEPATMVLFGVGLFALAVCRRRQPQTGA